MLVMAIETELDSLANCAETNVMTRSGYQIVTENELFFVSRERFLKKYKGNLYLIPGSRSRLLTFAEASDLRDTLSSLMEPKRIRVTGSHRSESFRGDGAHYSLELSYSDVELQGREISCEFSGRDSHVRIVTEGSTVTAEAGGSTFDIRADATEIVLRISGCFVDLSGTELKVMIIGNNNTVCGVAEGITVFSRGKKNEFLRKSGLPEEDPAKSPV